MTVHRACTVVVDGIAQYSIDKVWGLQQTLRKPGLAMSELSRISLRWEHALVVSCQGVEASRELA